MSKRTLTLIVALALVTFILVYIAVAPKQTSQTPYKAMGPKPTPVAASRLYMYPTTVTASPAGTVDVMLNSTYNKVTAVQLEITYDPKSLTSVDIVPTATSSSLIANPVVLIKNIDTVKGTISFAVAVPPSGKAMNGLGSIATISFRTVPGATGTTSLSFTPKTLVTAQGVSSSVLKESIGATIMLSSGAASAPAAVSPSPVPTR